MKGHALTDPARYSDKTINWLAYFGRERRKEIATLIGLDIISEHKANPLGYRAHHSWKLQRVLNYLRTQPILGKHFVYTQETWKDYRIAVVPERGKPLQILNSSSYPTAEAAMHGVFMLRVEKLQAMVLEEKRE